MLDVAVGDEDNRIPRRHEDHLSLVHAAVDQQQPPSLRDSQPFNYYIQK